MNLSDVSIVFGMCCTTLAGGAGLGEYYLQHEYVPISALVERDIRETRKLIRDLEYDQDHGGLTDKEEWQLEQYRDDLHDLEGQLD